MRGCHSKVTFDLLLGSPERRMEYCWGYQGDREGRFTRVGFFEGSEQVTQAVLIERRTNSHYRRNEMTYREQVSQWEETVSSHLPQLSKPQVAVLACWSYALVILKSVGMTQVSVWLAMLQGGKVDAWRQKLREWCYDAQDKKGDKRAQLEVAACFAPLLRWILRWWEEQERHLVLVVDASTLG